MLGDSSTRTTRSSTVNTPTSRPQRNCGGVTKTARKRQVPTLDHVEKKLRQVQIQRKRARLERGAKKTAVEEDNTPKWLPGTPVIKRRRSGTRQYRKAFTRRGVTFSVGDWYV